MASIFDVMDAMRLSLITAVANQPPLNPPLTSKDIFLDYPATDLLQNLAAKTSNRSIISIFPPPNMGRDVTRWAPFNLTPQTLYPTTLTSAVKFSQMTPGQSSWITILTAPSINDAVSCVVGPIIKNGTISNLGAVYITILDDTIDSTAAGLAAAINANAGIDAEIVAFASGAVVTVTNVGTTTLNLASYCGNNGSATRVLGNWNDPVMITAWTKSQAQRRALGNIIGPTIAQWMANFGLQLTDGTAVRLKSNSHRPGRDNHLPDIWRWDFLVDAEYSVTAVEQLYSILVPQFTKTLG